jgi:hypothetical protein
MKKITLLFLFLFAFVYKGNAQLSEGFEGDTFPPAGWASFIGENGLGVNENWGITTDPDFVHSGNQAAFVAYESGSGDINEDWLVTPQFTVTAPNTLLTFFQRQYFTSDYGTEYTIRVSTTSQTDISSFTIINTQTEADVPLTMTAKGIDLSAYVGQSIYVAFVMSQDDGDDWAIDDVSLGLDVAAPDCVTMTYPADEATDVAVGTPVTFTWEAATTGGTPDSYNFYGGTSLPLTIDNLIGNYTTTSADITVPNYNTTYYWMVVPTNLIGEAQGCTPFSFTSIPSPGYCLNAPNGQYPSDIFVPDCAATEPEIIDDLCYAGEYSVITVIAGNTYEFSSSTTTDFITISDDGVTALAYGITPLTWTATTSEDIGFFLHTDDQCGDEQVFRSRLVQCFGDLSTASHSFSGLRIYPNPVKDILNLTSDQTISKVQITNILGQEVTAKSVNATQGQLDMSNLASGTYFVKITSDSLVKTLKVIKE